MSGEEKGLSTGNYNPFFIDSDYVNRWETDLTDRALLGSIFAGYTTRLGSCCLGLEGFLQYGPTVLKNFDQGSIGFGTAATFFLDSETTTKIQGVQYGLDFLPGWTLPQQATLYFRLGVAGVYTKQEVVDINFGDALGDVWELPLSKTEKQWRPALRLGGGLEKDLNSRLSMRADYIFSDYGRYSLEITGAGVSAFNAPIESAFSVTQRVCNHAFTLSLAYYYCSQVSVFPQIEYLKPSFTGLYIGGGFGGAFCIKSQDGLAEGLQAQNPINKTTEPSPYLNDVPFQGRLFMGWGCKKSLFYMSAEISAQFLNTDTQESFDDTVYNDEPNNNLFAILVTNRFRLSPIQCSLDFRPGFFVLPTTLFYGRAGTTIGRVSVYSDARIDGAIPLIPETWGLFIPLEKKKTRAALHLGGGIEQQLTSKIHLGLDYAFTQYRKIELMGFDSGLSTIGNPHSLITKMNDEITSHTVLLSLSWHFR
ncbi:MAG: hypothetical protein S4CHLAM2_04010 [Chlamydiales bacterium]|nr:hypothetical protein [Chlamydiales bacterium]